MNCWICIFIGVATKNSCFSELVCKSSGLVLMISSFKDLIKDIVWEGLLYFQDLLLVKITYPLRLGMIDLLFTSKVLVFQIESKL